MPIKAPAQMQIGPGGQPGGADISVWLIVGTWFEHVFLVSGDKIRSFANLQIKAGNETETKKNGMQRFVAKKNAKPYEVSLSVTLSMALGCDVRDEVDLWVKHARNGKKDYFYVGDKKLLPCKLLLVDATAKNIAIGHNGAWTKAELQLTMKQCSKIDGTKTVKESSSKKASVKSSSTSTSKKASSSKTTSSKATSSKSSSSSSRDEAWKRLTDMKSSETSTKQAAAAAKKTTTSAKKNTAAKKNTGSSSSHKSLIHDAYMRKNS